MIKKKRISVFVDFQDETDETVGVEIWPSLSFVSLLKKINN